MKNKNKRIFKPTDELEFRLNPRVQKHLYQTTYNYDFRTLYLDEQDNLDFNSSVLSTKEYNDKKKQNCGIKTYKVIQPQERKEMSHSVSRVRIFEQPPSKRILDPSLRPPEAFQLKRSQYGERSIPLSPGSFQQLLLRTDKEESITKCRKMSNPKVYKSINIMNDQPTSPIIKFVNEGYKEKQMTSQIVSLPGCVKRDKYRIKDDHKFINKTNQGHVFKIERDYKSNIPGLTETREIQIPKHEGKRRDYNFNTTYDYGKNSDAIEERIRNDGFGLSSRGMTIKNAAKKPRSPNRINLFSSQIRLY